MKKCYRENDRLDASSFHQKDLLNISVSYKVDCNGLFNVAEFKKRLLWQEVLETTETRMNGSLRRCFSTIIKALVDEWRVTIDSFISIHNVLVIRHISI